MAGSTVNLSEADPALGMVSWPSSLELPLTEEIIPEGMETAMFSISADMGAVARPTCSGVPMAAVTENYVMAAGNEQSTVAASRPDPLKPLILMVSSDISSSV